MNGFVAMNASLALKVLIKRITRTRQSEPKQRGWKHTMKNEFTAIIEQDDNWYIAYCPEIPGANGQGKTREEVRKNLVESIALILENRREEGLRDVSPEAMREYIENRIQERPRTSVMAHFQSSAERNHRLGEMLAK